MFLILLHTIDENKQLNLHNTKYKIKKRYKFKPILQTIYEDTLREDLEEIIYKF